MPCEFNRTLGLLAPLADDSALTRGWDAARLSLICCLERRGEGMTHILASKGPQELFPAAGRPRPAQR